MKSASKPRKLLSGCSPSPRPRFFRKFAKSLLASLYAHDLGRGDLTSEILFPRARRGRARIFAREAGVFAGSFEVELFWNSVKFLKKDGDKIAAGETIAHVTDDCRNILRRERTVLNVIGRMSGISTMTARLFEKARKVNPEIQILPTRKTLWGALDKRACFLGGGGTHRINLSDAVLIKDNHLDLMGRDIEAALSKAFARSKRPRFVEIEVANMDEALRAAQFPCFIMLDNFSVQEVEATMKYLKQISQASHGDAARIFAKAAERPRDCRLSKNLSLGIEASGGITEENILKYVKTGVDAISIGSITASAKMLNVSLEFI